MSFEWHTWISSRTLSEICTPVSSLMRAMAFDFAMAFTSAHFCWNSGSSACSRRPCTSKLSYVIIMTTGEICPSQVTLKSCPILWSLKNS